MIGKENANWGDNAERVDETFSEALPIPIKPFGIILAAMLLAPRIIQHWFFPGLELVASLIGIVLVCATILWVVRRMMIIHKKKTGRNFNEDIIELQNRQD
ncbi:MAG: hypothetical protein JW772_03605 [Candidatus Diapherotrites archaeon]|nr:hypothetical protein [Candidatus Diapherotrites archaeon]